ncbi:CopL family metal-binding regulatory protein [Xanthomonas massiliensis]|uniref:CopL family metal-binding regulatory protein n=1 Tax=Xanthomonas massiliensis TaxID=1720302 RepID=UPI000824CF98|nr:CopL family metal-binding regulatory protein [Xanthomonas massiliensis]
MSPFPLLLRLLLCLCLVLNGPAALAAAPMPGDAMPAHAHGMAALDEDADCGHAPAAMPMPMPMHHAAGTAMAGHGHDCCDPGQPPHPDGLHCPHPCHAVGASVAVLPALPVLAAMRPLPTRFASVHAASASPPRVPLHRPPIASA